MKSVYIESSVISYITARPSRDVVTSARQAITIEWWGEYKSSFDSFVSELVIEEISSGDQLAAKRRRATIEKMTVLETTEGAIRLAKTLVAEKAVPETSVEDALHIAIASVQQIDFLLTWNFKHINNAIMRDNISRIILQQNYTCPVLCSPEELINDR